ncbi:hypothetical protein AYI68_g3795 [Smittium mucronatum]|uniref:Uncharacterized protein n=1 Tax=Smittium mucronatum TaxID=133383 RepID=A0A1R0GYU6_9FUNG|nr:hypothetical protein AYI68_g3795 [Smittium mucronatum]
MPARNNLHEFLAVTIQIRENILDSQPDRFRIARTVQEDLDIISATSLDDTRDQISNNQKRIGFRRTPRQVYVLHLVEARPISWVSQKNHGFVFNHVACHRIKQSTIKYIYFWDLHVPAAHRTFHIESTGVEYWPSRFLVLVMDMVVGTRNNRTG